MKVVLSLINTKFKVRRGLLPCCYGTTTRSTGTTQTCQCSTRIPCRAHPRPLRLFAHWCLHLENPCSSHWSPQRPHELKYDSRTGAPLIQHTVLLIAHGNRKPRQGIMLTETLTFSCQAAHLSRVK